MKYTVKKGDTLSGIASKYGVTVAAVAAANGIKNPNLIHAGQVIQIPEKTEDLKSALCKCLDDVEALPSYKKLLELIE